MKIHISKILATFIFLVTSSLAIADYIWDPVPIYRVELIVHTADKRYAGTDDAVYVQLDNSSHKFFLDYGRNDFERNSINSYDVMIPSIGSIGDITKIKIVKSGKDGLCIKKIELVVNDDHKMFSKNYNTNCRWIDGDPGFSNTLEFNYSDISNNPEFGLDTALDYPETFKVNAMESMVEAMVGNKLKQTPISGATVKWGYLYGNKYVYIKHKNNSTQAVDLDLKLTAAKSGITFKFALDVDLDFSYSCPEDNLILSIKNAKSRLTLKENSWGFIGNIAYWFNKKDTEETVQKQISDVFDGMSLNFGTCPDDYEIDSAGNLDMEWPPLNILDFLN